MTSPAAGRRGSVAIGPGLIGRKQRFSVTLLTEGAPNLAAVSPLVDVPVHQASEDDRRLPVWFLFVSATFAGVSVNVISERLKDLTSGSPAERRVELARGLRHQRFSRLRPSPSVGWPLQ